MCLPDLADGLAEREQALPGIYRKLGVRQRRDAIAVTHQRGLL